MNKKSNLEAEAAALASRQTDIMHRLNEFQSPFGTFPIGFTESITVFPIALTGGFLVVSALLAETIRLRSLYHGLSCRQGDQKDQMTQEIIVNTAPLRIEPTESLQNKISQFLILLLPAVIFVSSIGLIAFSWTIPDSANISGDRLLFVILYGICSALIVVGYFKIFKALQNYKPGRETQIQL